MRAKTFATPALLIWLASLLCLGLPQAALSHASNPAVVTALVLQDRVEITIRDAIEPILAISRVNPTSQADADRVNELYATLRAKDPLALDADLRADWALVAQNITLLAGGKRLDLQLGASKIPEVGDKTVLRLSTITLTAALPPDGTPVRFGWRTDFGPFAIHQSGGDAEAYTELLQGGQTSAAMPRAAPTKEATATVFARFVVSGFEHIVPKGLDHILFVLGLFFFSLRLKPILAQVTAFTLAHSVTLALSSLGIFTLPAQIVEPLIAASIAYVAIENIFFGAQGRVTTARIGVVFGFGLLHGLGFASVLSDVGLPDGQFVTGLLGFNIGVEFGQLAVILVALLALGLPFGRKPWYRRAIVIPASGLIAAMGIFWTIQRLLA